MNTPNPIATGPSSAGTAASPDPCCSEQGGLGDEDVNEPQHDTGTIEHSSTIANQASKESHSPLAYEFLFWGGMVAFFVGGWVTVAAIHKQPAVASLAVPTKVIDNQSSAAAVVPPIQAGRPAATVNLPQRIMKAAPIVSDDTMTSHPSDNSDRLRKIFNKSLEAADALK